MQPRRLRIFVSRYLPCLLRAACNAKIAISLMHGKIYCCRMMHKENFDARVKLDQLQAFVQVTEHGSFSAAARQLRLTQPAVSVQIRELERRFGVTLLERIGKRARPSAAGRDLLKHAARVSKAVEELQVSVMSHRGEITGSIRIGSGATACIYLLPKYLRRLKKRYPALEITVTTDNTSEIVQAVEENLLDLALVTLPVRGRSLQTITVMKDELVAIFPDFQQPEAKSMTAAALAEHPVLLYESGGNTRRIIDNWFMEAGVVPKPVMELGSIEAIKELVTAGLGCAVIPEMAVQKSDTYSVRPLRPGLHRELGLITRRSASMRPALNKAMGELSAIREAGA